MAIYAKNITAEQRNWLEQYEIETGVEPMHQDDLDSGAMIWREVVRANVAWFESWASDTLLRIQRDVPGQADDVGGLWSGIGDPI